MPIIEYRCAKQHTTEKILTQAQAESTPTTQCGHCRGIATRVAVSQTGTPILKKGIGGFYKPNA